MLLLHEVSRLILTAGYVAPCPRPHDQNPKLGRAAPKVELFPHAVQCFSNSAGEATSAREKTDSLDSLVQDSHDKVPRAGRLGGQKLTVSQFWRPEG